MKGRIIRFSVVALSVVVACFVLFRFRSLMGATLAYHSFWHYLVRYVAAIGGLFLLIVAIQALSVRSPTEILGTQSEPEVTFKVSNALKRIIDLTLSIFLLSLLFPILIAISTLIFIVEGPPVFYISQRYIALNRCVSVLKFRTMVRDAVSPKYQLRERFMRNGYLDIPLTCEVYTPIGRILERTQLVETLQLFNVLLHGMSLVGNRPLPRDNVLLLKQFDGWERRFNSPAGLTGLSQVVGKLNQTPEGRLELEGLYSELYRKKGANILLCDILIVYYTVRLLVLGKNLDAAAAKRLVVISSA